MKQNRMPNRNWTIWVNDDGTDRCGSCHGTKLVKAVDNHGEEYRLRAVRDCPPADVGQAVRGQLWERAA